MGTGGLDAALLALAKRQHGMVSREQALLAGGTKDQLRHRTRRAGWSVALPGVLRAPWSSESFEARAVAVTLWAGPHALLSHRAAAHLWGWMSAPRRIDVTAAHWLRTPAKWVVCHHVARSLRAEARTLAGWPVTGAARTLLDLASTGLKVDALAEGAIRQGQTTTAELSRLLAQLARPDARGTRWLRRFLPHCPADMGRTESPLEADALRLFTRGGLPPPSCQHRIALGDGTYARVDFAWPEAGVVVEVDSYLFHSGQVAWGKDLRRHNALGAAGWRTLRITAEDIRKRGAALIRQLAALLENRPRNGQNRSPVTAPVRLAATGEGWLHVRTAPGRPPALGISGALR